MNSGSTNGTSQSKSNVESNDSSSEDNSDSLESSTTHKCTHPGCTAKFSRPSRLARHIRQHTGERPYKCDYDGCEKAYTNSSHLKRHSQTHSMVKQSFKCLKCSLIISNQHNLKRHYERAHSEKNGFFCQECGLKFNKEHKYKEHIAVHQGIALYKCKICSRQCMTQSMLRKHENSHRNKKNYPCTAPDCAEVFEKWSLLCKHKKSKHINEYKCKNCDKVFSNKSHLKSHLAVHVDNRMILPCPYERCPRFYFFKRNLEHHVRSTHLGKKYHCDICDLRVSSKQKITEHMNKIHLAKKKKVLSRSKRRKRKDAGTAKKSMLTKLAGLDLPRDIEKELLSRKTRIDVDIEKVQSPDNVIENGKAVEFHHDFNHMHEEQTDSSRSTDLLM